MYSLPGVDPEEDGQRLAVDAEVKGCFGGGVEVL